MSSYRVYDDPYARAVFDRLRERIEEVLPGGTLKIVEISDDFERDEIRIVLRVARIEFRQSVQPKIEKP